MEYNYSQLSSDSVKQLVSSYYGISTPFVCKYYLLGLHDNYLIESEHEKFILRIYRNDWRRDEEIFFELELLSYLADKSLNVAVPIATKNSELSVSIDYPEGKRTAALFGYAEDDVPGTEISLEECNFLGVSTAKMREETKTSIRNILGQC